MFLSVVLFPFLSVILCYVTAYPLGYFVTSTHPSSIISNSCNGTAFIVALYTGYCQVGTCVSQGCVASVYYLNATNLTTLKFIYSEFSSADCDISSLIPQSVVATYYSTKCAGNIELSYVPGTTISDSFFSTTSGGTISRLVVC
jgi:hypothetical protein